MYTRDGEVVVYNQNAIAAWKTQAQIDIPQQQSELNLSLQQWDQKIKNHNIEIKSLIAKIKDKDHSMATINGEIALLERVNETDDNASIKKTKKQNYQLYLETSSLSQLRKALQDLENDKSEMASLLEQLESQKLIYRQHCHSINSKLKALDQDLQWLHYHINHGTQFLRDLKSHPHRLCEDLVNRILHILSNYDESHPRHQNIAVRKCLLDLPVKIKCILKPEEKSNSQNDFFRKEYLLLCGLVYHLCDSLAENRSLMSALKALLNDIHIDRHGDFPDDLQRNYDCLTVFSAFNHAQSKMKDSSDDELNEYEAKEFAKALQSLKNINQGSISSSLKNKIDLLISNVETLAKSKQDIKFLTTIIKRTTLLTENRGHVERYEQLAKLADKSPSSFKKVSGGLLTAAGTAAGTYAYATAKNAQSYDKTSLGIGIVGLMTSVAGLCLFGSGKRQLLSRDMMEVARAYRNISANAITKVIRYGSSMVD